MAQVIPAYRLLADQAEKEWHEARRLNLPAPVTAYLKENAEAWQMIDHVLTLSSILKKSLCTGERSIDMLHLTIAKSPRFSALIPKEEN